MVRKFVWPSVLALGLVTGCVASDSLSEEAAAAGALSNPDGTGETALPPATTNGCVQLTRPRVEYWSEFPPEPGTPAPLDPYKVCVTQSDCSSVCEGVDVVPSVYSWHLVIHCTKCT
jgi:hypothetical protein